MKELIEKAERVGILTERGRIMDEILKANLPAGVWTMLKKIINPED